MDTPDDMLMVTTTNSSAAARVFAILELLEGILLCHAQDEAHITEPQQYTPAISLFTYQRVSTTFKNTIRACPRLRRLMFISNTLPSSPETIHLLNPSALQDSGNLRPLWWFFELLTPHPYKYMSQPRTHQNNLIRLEYQYMEADPNDRETTHDVSPGIYRCGESKLEKILRPEASWRQMMLFRAASDRQIIFCQPIVTVTNGAVLTTYEEDFHLQTYGTLGEFWDDYDEVISRTFEEHQDAAAFASIPCQGRRD